MAGKNTVEITIVTTVDGKPVTSTKKVDINMIPTPVIPSPLIVLDDYSPISASSGNFDQVIDITGTISVDTSDTVSVSGYVAVSKAGTDVLTFGMTAARIDGQHFSFTAPVNIEDIFDKSGVGQFDIAAHATVFVTIGGMMFKSQDGISPQRPLELVAV